MRNSLLFAGLLLFAAQAIRADYDPRAEGSTEFAVATEFAVEDAKRGRTIPIRIFKPDTTAPAPLLLFSHGLGGSRMNNTYLGEHWASHGYCVVFMQHPGSDESVWQDAAPAERMQAMHKAANGRNAIDRYKDVPVVLDQLEHWNASVGHPLHQSIDLTRIGMSGHSFGANTTQGVSGQQFGRGFVDFNEPRIDAALAFSPNAPKRQDPAQAFGSVGIPWLLMTGTEDLSPIGGATIESRRAVFPALPEGDKYELVLFEAEHLAFSDSPRGKRNPNHHPAILAISLAFWDGYLKDDEAARKWLQGDGVREVLDPKDRWQYK